MDEVKLVVENTSIFQTTRVACARESKANVYLRAMFLDTVNFRCTGSWTMIERAAMKVISEYAPPKRLAELAEFRTKGGVANGLPIEVFDLADDAPPIAHDAAQVLMFGWLAQAIVKGKTPDRALQYAFGVGRAFERMLTRCAEPSAAIGKKIDASAKKGHAATHGTDAEKAARWTEYCREVDKLRRPGVKLERVYSQVARKFGVAEKTIRRALKWRQSLDTAGHCPD